LPRDDFEAAVETATDVDATVPSRPRSALACCSIRPWPC